MKRLLGLVMTTAPVFLIAAIFGVMEGWWAFWFGLGVAFIPFAFVFCFALGLKWLFVDGA